MPGRENKMTSTPLWKNLSKNFLQRFYSWVLGNILSSPWEITFISFPWRGVGVGEQGCWEAKTCRGGPLSVTLQWKSTLLCKQTHCNAKLNTQHFPFSFKQIYMQYRIMLLKTMNIKSWWDVALFIILIL